MEKKVLPNTSLPSPSKDLSNKISSYLYSQNDLENSKKFLDIKPFPYVVIDDFLPREICNQIEEYGRNLDSLNPNMHLNSKKLCNHQIWKFDKSFKKVIDYFYEKEFLNFLENLTGYKNLKSDYAYNWGGGFHVLPKDGFLNVHVDFNIHPHSGYLRKINVLLYLNKNWTYEDGGSLELWDMNKEEKFADIVPKFNRCVIFDTGENSWHGNPRKVKKSNLTRMSLSLYYYIDVTEENKPSNIHSTIYVDSPGQYTNLFRKLFIPLKAFTPVFLRKFIRKFF